MVFNPIHFVRAKKIESESQKLLKPHSKKESPSMPAPYSKNESLIATAEDYKAKLKVQASDQVSSASGSAQLSQPAAASSSSSSESNTPASRRSFSAKK